MVGGESNCAAPGVLTVWSEEVCSTCGVRRVHTGLLAECPNYLVRQVSLGLDCLENTHLSETKRIGFLFCTLCAIRFARGVHPLQRRFHQVGSNQDRPCY